MTQGLAFPVPRLCPVFQKGKDSVKRDVLLLGSAFQGDVQQTVHGTDDRDDEPDRAGIFDEEMPNRAAHIGQDPSDP